MLTKACRLLPVVERDAKSGRLQLGRTTQLFRFAALPLFFQSFSAGCCRGLRADAPFFWREMNFETFSKAFQRELLVGDLAPRSPTGYADARRAVRQSDCGFHLIGVLPSRSTRAKRFHIAFRKQRIVGIGDDIAIRHDFLPNGGSSSKPPRSTSSVRTVMPIANTMCSRATNTPIGATTSSVAAVVNP